MKKSLSLLSSFLFAGAIIPLDQPTNWQLLKYSKIPSNKIHFSAQGLNVTVKNSSSPLIYPFSQSKKIQSIYIKAKVMGQQLHFPANTTQGSKGYDDFQLRVGLVEQGEKTLNWMQRQMAPDWVVTLFKLAPKGVGVRGITYLNAVNQTKLLHSSRKHPLSELLQEDFITAVGKDGSIEIKKTYSNPPTVLALWIAVDGDDTKSSYQTLIEKIEITEL